MPTLNLATNTLRYFASDLRTMRKALELITHMAEHDSEAKQDATTALNAVKHLVEHVERKRS